MKLDLNTIDIFGGKISDKGNLFFSGEIENSWCILYRDCSSFETENFYKIINLFDDSLIQNFCFFRNINEAILTFQFQKKEKFRNSLIVIGGMKSIPFLKRFLEQHYFTEKKILAGFNFFHSLGNFDMVTLYLEFLEREILYQQVQIEGKSYLNIQYRNIDIQLSYSQISKSKICFLLGINDRKFNVRNHFMFQSIIRQKLIW